MLPTQLFAKRIERIGFQAGYDGVTALNAPKLEPARTHWLSGWDRGARERRIDMQAGTHPELTARPEFGVQRGVRRGVAAGAKK